MCPRSNLETKKKKKEFSWIMKKPKRKKKDSKIKIIFFLVK